MGPPIAQTITKSKQAVHAMKLIRLKQTRTTFNSKIFLRLNYNSEIWRIPSLNAYLTQELLVALAAGLWLCTAGHMHMISYSNLHTLNKRATPGQHMLNKHS